MFEIIICDDDDTCLKQTHQLVNDWSASVSVPVSIKSMTNADKLIEYCSKSSPDVILLDIMMPFVNGMDAAKEIRSINTTSKIIFLTSSPEFAIESYDVEAAGYLLKPVKKAKLFALLDKCLSEINKPMASITLHTVSGYQNVYLHNIEYLEAQNKRVMVVLSDGSKIETISTLSFYETQLTIDKGFFKCHRSYIVYMPAIDHFNSNEIITKTGMKLSVARGLGKLLQDTYFSYMFSE